MKKTLFWVLVLVLGSALVFAAVVDEEVTAEVQEKGEASVIVVLHDFPETVAMANDEGDENTASGEGDENTASDKITNDKMSEFSTQSRTGGVNSSTTIGKILSTKNHPEQVQSSGLPTEDHLSVTGGSLEAEVLSDLDIKETPFDKEYDFELKRKHSRINAFSGEITEEGLEKLQVNPLVKRVYYNEILHPFLTSSVPQIGAQAVWNFSVGGYNITGELETICVIDTGIDTDHPAFQDKIVDQHCFCNVNNVPCCAGSKAEALTAEDDQGHGTHVAGIAMGNYGTYMGVAKGAKIVAVKVCNNSSSAGCTTADVISAIDWCANNATAYNISVISISLGSGGPYNNTYCNEDVLAASINSAAGKEISVVIAAGNEGFTAGISSPACVQNATPVGGVNAADSIIFNRGRILDLLAPGVSITAPYLGGGTVSLTGTSMSAPHLSGAIALFRQYWRLAYGAVPAIDEIERKLTITGVPIEDSSSGKTYARVNILAALQPFINYTLSSVANNSLIGASGSVVVNVSSDVNLSQAVVEWSYVNGTVHNLSLEAFNGFLGNVRNFYLTVTNLPEGQSTYKIYGYDSANTLGLTIVRSVTVDISNPLVRIIIPADNSYVSTGLQQFSVSIWEANINQVLFSFTNGTGKAFNITPANVSGIWAAMLPLAALEEGSQSLVVLVKDMAGNYNHSVSVQFTVDRTAPTIQLLAPIIGRNFSLAAVAAGNQTFNITVRDLWPVESVLFSFDNASGASFNITAVNQSGYWVAQYNLSSLAEGNHTLTILANDSAGNYNRSKNITFTLDFTVPAVIISAPPAGSDYTLLSSNQTFTASGSDVLGIETVKFQFSNASGTDFNATAVVQNGIWTASYNVSTLANGSQSVAVYAIDKAGNINASESLTFNVDVARPLVTLITPVNGYNSPAATVLFSCSAADTGALSSAVLYGNWGSWHANMTNNSLNGNQASFSLVLADGQYRWNCLVTDAAGIAVFAANNYTLAVDTKAPKIMAVSSEAPGSGSATITWSTDESANSSLNYGTSLSLGTISSSTTRVTAHSRTLSSGLSAATAYYFNVTSCDSFGHCNTTGAYNFTTSAASGTGSSDDVSGTSPGGGSGGSSTAIPAATTSDKATTAESLGTASESASETAAKSGSLPPPAENVYSQQITLTVKEPTVINIVGAAVAATQLEIESTAEKQVVFTVSYLPESPVEAVVPNVYQYFEMVLNLTPEEIKRAVLTFSVPEKWLNEHDYLPETAKLHTYEDDEWKELETKFLGNIGGSFQYQGKFKHFSYFAISARTEAEPSWWEKTWEKIFSKADFNSNFNSKPGVLVGVLGMVIILALGYWLMFMRNQGPDEF